MKDCLELRGTKGQVGIRLIDMSGVSIYNIDLDIRQNGSECAS